MDLLDTLIKFELTEGSLIKVFLITFGCLATNLAGGRPSIAAKFLS
jgi:hypothetical protein